MDAWLGVKGSRVQIPPSRRFFEHLESQMGTKIMAGRPGTGASRVSVQDGDRLVRAEARVTGIRLGADRNPDWLSS